MMNRKAFVGVLGLAAPAALTVSCRGREDSAEALPAFDASRPQGFWRAVQDQFTLKENRTYLNCGGLGPAPKVVQDKVVSKMRELQAVSETGHSILGETRKVAARFFGSSEDEVCFTRNATESNSIIASGIPMQAGDEVIFESHAHPGGSFPWLNRQNMDGIRVKVFDPDPNSMENTLNRINDLITDRTKAIQVSHITAPTGILFDIEAIGKLAEEKGIWFHVDGAQSAGMIPIDFANMKCHSYATSGHKWLGGPRGTGLLLVRQDRIESVVSWHVGAYSESEFELPDRFKLRPTALRFEYGTRNSELIAGLGAAMEFQESIGKDRIDSRSMALASRLREQLEEIDSITVITPKDASMRRAITTFRSDRMDFDELNNRMSREFALRCRRVTEVGLNAVRVSTHIFNSEQDCDRVAEAVAKIVVG
jgi:selenocysteine lyase/cysteine desulfurase